MELVKFDLLRRVALAVVIKPPRSHLTRETSLHRYDEVAVPRPGVQAVKFAGFCRMVRVGMVPADNLEVLFACQRFRGESPLRLLSGRSETTRRVSSDAPSALASSASWPSNAPQHSCG